MAHPPRRPPFRRAQPNPDVARRRLLRLGRLRASRGTALATVLTLLLGLALVVQVRTVQAGDLEELPESELVALLDDVTERSEDLESEIEELESERRQLEGARGDEAALEAAQSRLESYQILAGTAPAQGPGVVVLVTDDEGGVSATTFVDMMHELRDAGAEAISIGGVRVVASSWVQAADDGTLRVDGQAISSPYRVVALGDPHTLYGALNIPGGFSDSVRRVGAETTITEVDVATIDALHESSSWRYAQPVPTEDSR